MIEHYFAAGELAGQLVDHLAVYRSYFEAEGTAELDRSVAFVSYCDIARDVPTFLDEMRTAPATTIVLLSLAACQAFRAERRLTVRLVVDKESVQVTRFHELKASLIGQWGVFVGTVVKAASPRPLVEQAVFECGRCGAVQAVRFKDGLFRQPAKCTTMACSGRTFSLVRNHPDTKYRIWQRIRIQECNYTHDDNDDDDYRGIPKSLEVDLYDDLVERATPGEQVMVSGVVKVDEGESSADVGKLAISYSLYLDCNNLVLLHENNASGMDRALLREKITFGRLVASLCPAIFGHSMVKAGLLLSLFGGSRHPRRRSDIHVLLLGDPGLGKSELLNAVARVAPRVMCVSANSATAAGLTAAITHEGGEFGLEAGALVVADGGVCCIDELDKAAADHKCMLEVMEQQQVNIAKAGILCSLPARTSVIAAANPVKGHYNPNKALPDNIKLDLSLLSRFDLLFLLLDRADAQLDRYLSERIVRSASQHSQRSQATNTMNPAVFSDDDEVVQLASRLSCPGGPPLSADLLKEYIQRAKEQVHPRLSGEAKEYIQQYYLTIRRNRDPNLRSTLPTTIRQLEALIRLSEARARSELRALVSLQDAVDAVALVKFATSEFHVQSAVQTTRAGSTGRGGQMKQFMKELTSIAARTQELLYSEQQLRQLHATLRLTVPYGDLIESLNHNGYLLKKDGSYKVLSS